MTKYFQELLTKLRNDTAPTHNKHHLFLLGTGVNYVDRPKTLQDGNDYKSYIRGETFSYAAQVVTHMLDEQKDTVKHADATQYGKENYAHAYHSPSVDVINGADLLGREVGDRLAKGLMLSLGAIAEGKTELAVSGFSRGGVEAIVLMHELERVRSALEKDLALTDSSKRRSLATIIADSNSVTGISVPYLGNPSFTATELTILVGNKVALSDDLALKTKLLDNLKNMKVNLFVLDPVPGGNYAKVPIGWQEDSFYKELPEFVVKKQEFVQKHETSNCFKPIVPNGMPYEVIPGCHGTGDGNQFDHNSVDVPENLGKLSGVQDLVLRRWLDFTFPDAKPDFRVDLGHSDLDKVTNAYLLQSESERNKQLLLNYTAIQENYPAFEWLATRSYNGLGQYMPQRQVHFRTRGNTPVTDLDAHGDGGKHFLNLQHVQLWMSENLKSFNFFEKTLVEQVKWLNVNISNAFKSHEEGENSEEWMLTKLLANKSNHELIKQSLSFLINTVTQTYMRNHISDEQRQACQKCVKDTFEILQLCALGNSHPRKDLAKKVEDVIRHDLTTTMLRHQNSLLSVAQQLLLDQENISHDVNNPEAVRQANDSPLTWMVGAQKLYFDLGLLVEQTQALEPWCSREMLEASWGKIIPNFSGKDMEPIGFEACKENLKNYIQQQRKLLLTSATELLSKMPSALENQPAEMNKEFYTLIHSKANVNNLQANLKKLEDDAKLDQDEITLLLDEKNDLLKKHKSVEERLKAFNNEKEESTLLEIASLKTRTRIYLSHLRNTDDGSQLHKDKSTAVKEMLGVLNDCSELPSERVKDFHIKLDTAKDLLKEHRDPEWQRFFRDCFRILARVFSGTGFYRMANGESPQFFRPTNGEQFVENVQLKPAPAV